MALFTTYIGSERLFPQFLLKILKIIETSVVAAYGTGTMQKTGPSWFGGKNLANNYQNWTLRFLPFPTFKSLALSTELIGGLLKNFSGSRARYASPLLSQKFYCSNSKNSKTRSPKQIDKIQKIIEILIEKFSFFPTSTEYFLTRFL